MYVLIGLFCVASALVFWFYGKVFSIWKNAGIPYLKPSIPFGNAGKMVTGEAAFGVLFFRLYEEIRNKGWKHGGVYFFTTPVYIPRDPVIIKDIIVSSSDYFKNHGFYITKNDILTNHMFNLEDSRWRDIRSKLSHCFTSGKLRQNFLVMKKCSEILSESIQEHLDLGLEISIKTILSRFTTDVVAGATMGIEPNTLKKQNLDLLRHSQLFFEKTWCNLNNAICLTIPHNILKKFNYRVSPMESEIYWKNLFQSVKEQRQSSGIRRNDVFDAILDLSDESYTSKINDYTGKPNMKPLTLEESISQAYVFLVAGHETSSATISYALYEMSKNQDVQNRLRKEINEVLDKYGELTYDAVQDMKYLDMVMQESLRLYPTLPLVPRKCNQDYKIPGTDSTIKKDTPVFISNIGLHRDPEFWVNPEKFDPERFSPENKDKIIPYTFLPFGEGPRICVAHRFGQLQAKVGILTIIKNYRVTESEKMVRPFQFCPLGLNLKAKGGMWLNFEKIVC